MQDTQHNADGAQRTEGKEPNATAASAESEQSAESQSPADSESAELQDRLLRALAEADNARKRADRSRQQGREAGIADFAAAIIPALDSLALALAALRSQERDLSAHVVALRDGLRATQREFLAAFSKFGVQPVEPKQGDPFDPACHEAVAMRSSSAVQPGEVVELLQSGYSVGNRLIRPARVVIAQDG